MLNNAWQADPKRLAFTFARYKHVARILDGHDQVVEVGANSAFASRVVAPNVGELTVTDAVAYPGVEVWNPVHGEMSGRLFDSAYALDVLEHVPPEQEHAFMLGVTQSISGYGNKIIGMP